MRKNEKNQIVIEMYWMYRKNHKHTMFRFGNLFNKNKNEVRNKNERKIIHNFQHAGGNE